MVADCGTVEVVETMHKSGRDPMVDIPANVRRIAACVNACDGVPTEWLENYANQEMAEFFGQGRPLDEALRHWMQEWSTACRQRDELVAILKVCMRAIQFVPRHKGEEWDQQLRSAWVSARDALVAIKGSAA
jgi:hypothetical protein